MNETFVVPCWNVTLVVMHILHDLRTGITGYGSDFQYSLAVDGVKVFFSHKLGFCRSHRLAGTVIHFACVHIVFRVFRRTVYVGPFNVNCYCCRCPLLNKRAKCLCCCLTARLWSVVV